MLPALPFAIIAAVGVPRIVIGPGWGLLPLLAVGPAVAAAVGGLLYTLAAGAVALAVCLLIAADMQAGATRRMTEVAFLAVAGVTAAGGLASRARGHRDRELAQARLVAEAVQQVLLRPVPRQAGPVRLAVGYLSASSGAPRRRRPLRGSDHFRMCAARVGDAKGKGLPVGLGQLADVPRIPVTIPFEPGDALLFYTDGASEARNKAGVFFPLADCAAVRAPPDPATLADRLGDEVVRHVWHAPDDDVALLVIYRDGAHSPGCHLRAGASRPATTHPPVRQQPGTPVYATDLGTEGVRKALAAASPERPAEWRA